MPAPMMQASAWRFSCSGGNSGIAAVPPRSDWWRAMKALRARNGPRLDFAQRDELLGCGGMDADGLVELRLGGAELHRDRHPGSLAGVRADHVRADHALARPVDHQLHEGALLLVRHGELEAAERRLVDVDRAVALARPSSDRPTVARLGLANTAVGTFSWSTASARCGTACASHIASAVATGVRLMRLVTSPTAWMERRAR